MFQSGLPTLDEIYYVRSANRMLAIEKLNANPNSPIMDNSSKLCKIHSPRNKIWAKEKFHQMRHAPNVMIIRKHICMPYGCASWLNQFGNLNQDSPCLIRSGTGLLWIFSKLYLSRVQPPVWLCSQLLFGAYGKEQIELESNGKHLILYLIRFKPLFSQ